MAYVVISNYFYYASTKTSSCTGPSQGVCGAKGPPRKKRVKQLNKFIV